MVKHTGKNFCATLTVVFLSISLPWALTSNSWAQHRTVGKTASMIEQLKSKNQRQRLDAIDALSRDRSPDAIDTLIAALKSPDREVRSTAADVLAGKGVEAKAAVPALIVALKDPDNEVRSTAGYALGSIGMEAKAAVPELIVALKDPDKHVRSTAVYALGNMGTEAKQVALPELIVALKDPDKHVRGTAAHVLGSMDGTAQATVNALIGVLKDPDQDVRNTVAYALGRISVNLQDKADQLSPSDLEQMIPQWEVALSSLEDPQTQFPARPTADVGNLVNTLKAKKSDRLLIDLIDSTLKHPWFWGVGIYLVSIFGMFWLRPLWLLKIDQFLKPVGFKIPGLGVEISPSLLLLFTYHPRVLDAWVTFHLPSVREEFNQQNTVRHRNIYIPIPVALNGNILAELTCQQLRSTFKQQQGYLLICGEIGTGKTSLACQIGKWAMSDRQTERLCEHRMLPLLIEEELDFAGAAGQQPFISAIREELQHLTNHRKPISEQLLKHLLRQQRLLVIVDRYSEMSQATRMAIRPQSPNFCVNALVITSRVEATLGQLTKNTLKPLGIQGNRLASFLEAYLIALGKRALFTDSEFFNACSHLSLMMGQRNITPLEAKLYAEHLIAVKESQSSEQISDNISDVTNKVSHWIAQVKGIILTLFGNGGYAKQTVSPNAYPSTRATDNQVNETKDADAYFNQAVARQERGDLEGAIADYNKVMEIDPDCASAYYNRGVAYHKLGKLKAAIADYSKMIEINPDYAAAYYNRGAIRDELGDLEGAIADYSKMIEIHPDYAPAYYNRGAIRDRLGDKQGAIADYNKTIEINPNYAEAYYNRGVARQQLEDKQGAIADYNRAIAINPDYAEAYYNRGAAYHRQGDLEAAIADYNQVIAINPNYGIAYYNRGNAREQLGDLQGAISDYNKVITINPNYGIAYYNRGNVRDQLGDKQGAIADYNKAIEINPNYAEAYYNRGIARYDTGDKQTANEDFHTAAQLYQQQGNKQGYQKALNMMSR